MSGYILETYKVGMENINISKKGGRTANLENYIDYLLNGDHDNHIDRTEILNTIGDKNKMIVDSRERVLKNVEHRKKVNRGRPLKVSHKSLTFNIPKDYEVSEEDCIAIQMSLIEMIKALYAKNGYELDSVEFFSNIHFQANKHINVVIPYLSPEGKILPFTKSRKRFFMFMAREFTKIVDNRLNTNINDYRTKQQQIQEADRILKNMGDLTLSEIQELKEIHKNNKLIKRALDYAYKIINAVGENKQKSIDRLVNTIETISADGKVTEEEYAMLVKVLRNNGFLKGLTEDAKKKIYNSIK